MDAAGVLQRSAGTQNQIRSVSSVEFPVDGSSSFDRVISTSVKWMRGLNAAIPHEALNGAEFEVGGGGDHPARAVLFEFDEGRIWSSTVDNPDKYVLGRTWVTEITVAQRLDLVSFGARLLSVTRQVDEPYVPSIPRVVRDIVNRNNCKISGARLYDKPSFITNDTEVEWLVALIKNSARTIPVIVVAEAILREPIININLLAARTCGAAYVVGLSKEQQSQFRDFTGRDFAVFDGSVRLFWTKFNADTSDPYSQPLWIPSADRLGMWANTSVIYRVLSASVSKGTTDYPRFQAVRQAAAEISLRKHRANSTDAELSKLYENENNALRMQLQDLRDEQNQWLLDAEQDKIAAEREIAELKYEIYKAKSRNDILQISIEQSGAQVYKENLIDLVDFREWSSKNLSSRIWIAAKAIKELEKNSLYRDPEEIGQALYFLDDYYSVVKNSRTSEKYLEMQSKLADLGFEISPCFAKAGDIKGYPEYSVMYQDDKLWCDMHLKRGGGTDPRSMFRIYFVWHDASKTLVVGHLPTHLDNNMTN